MKTKANCGASVPASGKVKAAAGGYMKVHKSTYGKKEEMYGGGAVQKKKKKPSKKYQDRYVTGTYRKAVSIFGCFGG